MENEIRPKRTLEIHGYAAEEIGLVDLCRVSGYRKNDVNVKAMVQFDLALYTEGVVSKRFTLLVTALIQTLIMSQ